MERKKEPIPGCSNEKKKTTKPNNKMPNIKEMSKEEIQAALVKKRECDGNALKIVERLIENPVPAPWFIYCLRFINQCHLDDVFEERSLINQCGYPICVGVLPNVPKKQYMISTKVNKIYDITERKKFCSDKCFKAAIFIREQMLTSPLWLRDKEEIPDFKLLPWTTKGIPGLEVDFGLPREVEIEPPQFTSVSDFAKSSLEETPDTFEDIEKQSFLHEEETSPEKLTRLIKKSNENRINRKTIESQFSELVSEDEQFKYSKHQLKLINLGDKSQAKKLSEQISIESFKERLENRRKAMLKQQAEDREKQKAKSSEKCSESISLKSMATNTVDANKIIDKKPLESEFCLIQEKVKSEKVEKPEVKSKNLVETTELEKPQITRKLVEEANLPKQLETVGLSTTEIAINHVEKAIHEWFSIDSLIFLYGREQVKNEVSSHSQIIQEKLSDVLKESTNNLYENEAYIKLCKKIDLLELEEERYENSVINKNLKPLPDYRMLRAENKRLIVKVRSFYNGNMEFDDPGYSESETSEEDDDSDEDDEDSSILPTVDKSSQNVLRRQIVYNCLSKTIPGLLQTFGLTSHDMTSEIRQLISTFDLTAKNIIFKPIHLNLLSIIILRLLGEKNRGLFKLMEEPTAVKYSRILLGIYKLPDDYLNIIVKKVTNIENIVDNHCHINK